MKPFSLSLLPSLLAVKGPLLMRSSVRYARKPRWVPIAKSKMFVNIELPNRPIHEYEEMTRLEDNYETYSTSLWAFQRRINEDQLAKSQSVSSEGTEEAELDRILAETKRDNEIVRQIREKQLAEEWKQIEADILAEKSLLEDKALQEMQETEEKLQIQLSKLKSIITLENLDAAIEQCLANEVSYSFALDKDGNILKGNPWDAKKQDSKA